MTSFIGMMNELRDQMTPEMRARMDGDAMWELMESGDLEEMMEEHGQGMRGMPGMPGMGGHGGGGRQGGHGG
jgi:hypothetical protein